MPSGRPFVVAGVDLAGSPRRATGLCILRGNRARTRIALDDEEILSAIREARPDIVPMDAPLSLPAGRASIHDRSGEHLRPCDRELQKMGIRFFPITLGPMRMLTERGLRLKSEIEKLGFRPVECYPRWQPGRMGPTAAAPEHGGIAARLAEIGRKGHKQNDDAGRAGRGHGGAGGPLVPPGQGRVARLRGMAS